MSALDAEAMVADAIALAERKIQGHREEAGRMKAQIATLDDQIGQYMPLLLDRDLELLAKKAIGQRIAKAQAEQDQLHAALDHGAEQTRGKCRGPRGSLPGSVQGSTAGVRRGRN